MAMEVPGAPVEVRTAVAAESIRARSVAVSCWAPVARAATSVRARRRSVFMVLGVLFRYGGSLVVHESRRSPHHPRARDARRFAATRGAPIRGHGKSCGGYQAR